MLSIIIPTYNSQNTIKRCLKSILNIRKIKYEILLVDDGSSDNTINIIKKYIRTFKNIRGFFNKHMGTSFERNLGIINSRGDLICFIDSDDYINAKNLENVIIKYNSKNTDLIITNLNINHRKLSNKSSYKTNINNFIRINYPLYGHELIHTIGNKIYNKRVIKKYNLRFPHFQGMGEDLIFNLDFMLHSSEIIKYINITYYNYLININSTTNTFEKHPLNNRLIIIDYIKRLSRKFNINNKKIINNLLIKIIYSSLLNIFKQKFPFNKKDYIKSEINSAYYNNLIPKDYRNCNLEYKILLFILDSRDIFIIYYSLLIINILRKIKFIIKPY